MLTLNRRCGEAIILQLPEGQEVVITVAEVRRDRVRLAIDAPLGMPVFREEVLRNEEES